MTRSVRIERHRRLTDVDDEDVILHSACQIVYLSERSIWSERFRRRFSVSGVTGSVLGMATSTNSRRSTMTMPSTSGAAGERHGHNAGAEGTSRYRAPLGSPTLDENDAGPFNAVAARLTFVPLVDLDVERRGFRPDSDYVEYCLLPLIGPSSCLLYRHIGPLVCRSNEVVVDLGRLARNLGLGAKGGPNSAVVKALTRLEMFHLGRWLDGGRYALRRAVSPLGDRQAQRLPEPARSIHYRSLRHCPAIPSPSQARRDPSGFRT